MDDKQQQREVTKQKIRLQFKMAYLMLKSVGGDVEVPQSVKDAYKKQTTEPTKKGKLTACLLDGMTMCDLLEIKCFLELVLMDSLNYIMDHPKEAKKVDPMEILTEMLGGE